MTIGKFLITSLSIGELLTKPVVEISKILDVGFSTRNLGSGWNSRIKLGVVSAQGEKRGKSSSRMLGVVVRKLSKR
jgi:hypothetical protein